MTTKEFLGTFLFGTVLGIWVCCFVAIYITHSQKAIKPIETGAMSYWISDFGNNKDGSTNYGRIEAITDGTAKASNSTAIGYDTIAIEHGKYATALLSVSNTLEK